MKNKLLLTGFEGYGGRSENPSEEIVQALDGITVGATTIYGRVLPVVNSHLRENIVNLIVELKPSVILCLGLAPGENMIRLERIAANYSKFEIKDNAGEIFHGPILPEGPAAYESTLPMNEMLAAVHECGIPARLSNSAGTYLCNAVMYHALDYCAVHYPDTKCGFVHLPYMPSQVTDLVLNTKKKASLELTQRSDLASMALELQIEAIKAITEQLCSD